VILNDSISVQLGVFSPSRGAVGAAASQEASWPSPDVGYGELAVYPSGPMRWRRYFGFWYPHGEHTLHLSPTSVADVDGDGIPELIVSVHRERWDLKVYDILSGEEKLSVPDLYLHATVDLDGDGVAEIVAATERIRTPREFTELVIGRKVGSGWERLYEAEGCRLEHGPSPIWSPGFYGRNKDPRVPVVLQDGTGKELVLSQDLSGTGRADAFLLVSGGPGEEWAVRRITLDSQDGVRILAAGRDKIIASWSDGTMQVLDPEGRALSSWRCGSPFAGGVAVADIDGDGANELVFSDAKRHIVALSAPSEGTNGPRELWSTDGWGIPAPHTYGPMPIIADLDGDGKKAVISACVGGDGGVAIQAIDYRGQARWRTPVPGAVDTHLYPSITCATVGDFDGDGLPDVYVSGRVAMTGNDASHSFVLRGRDGLLLWHNDASDPSLALHTLGPTALATVADVDGDGADDVLLVALDMCTALNGRDGSFLQPPVIAGEIWKQEAKDTQWTAYGTQLPVDLDSDGRVEVLMCASWGQWGAWTMDRRLL
jgi:outer membrane protein assembly factor BamB